MTVIDSTLPQIERPLVKGFVKPFPEVAVANEQEALQTFNLAADAYRSCILEVESLLNQDKERRANGSTDSR